MSCYVRVVFPRVCTWDKNVRGCSRDCWSSSKSKQNITIFSVLQEADVFSFDEVSSVEINLNG